MQFKVPQFLEIEDTIFGPFTFKQFVYLAGGGGICFILYKLLGFLWGSIPILLVAGLSLALTFYRPNGKPFIDMVQSAFNYLFQSKLYIWKQEELKRQNIQKKSIVHGEFHQTSDVKLNRDKLKDLAWSLDILDKKTNKEN